jgi:protein-S-isoprenylcysteine O-methyltransferase Ste14
MGIIFIVVSVLWVASEIILSRTRRSQSTDIQRDKSSLRLIWITIAVAVTAGVVIGFQRIGYFGNGSIVFLAIGLILIVCGLVIRWIAILSLKRQFTVDVAITSNHRIIRNGIYRYVRHPSYARSLLSFLGLGLCFSNYISLVIIVVPLCAVFLHRIRVEEEALVQAFGKEYVDYCASTKRLIPGIF